MQGILFDKAESATYIDLAKHNQTNLTGLLSESNRKRLEFTISLIAAASAIKDAEIWSSKILSAIDAFVGKSLERKHGTVQEQARRELKTLLQERRDCVLNLFGFDGSGFQMAIRDQPYTELSSQLQLIAKRFVKLFDAIKVPIVTPQEKKGDIKRVLSNRLSRIEQFLTAVTVTHILAFDNSYQLVKRMLIICKCRTYEGRYINNSLEQVRNIVRDVIQQQQQEKGKLRTTPAFADACLPVYCNPFKDDCLESKGDRNRFGKEISLSSSLLMNTISTKIGNLEFQDMKIAVFTVFLMNRTINNDPPVPFIYAEDLRSEFIRLKNLDTTRQLVEFIGKYLTGAAKTNVLKKIDRLDSDLVSEIKPEIVNDLRLQIAQQRARLGVNIANGLESQLETASAKSMNTIAKLLRAIDGINAVHPVGTLQVTDSIAKFNLSDLYCSFSRNSSPFVAQLREKLQSDNCFVDIMNHRPLTLRAPADPVDSRASIVGGSAMFDPKTIDEFLHQWLVTTGSTFSDYLSHLSQKVEEHGNGRFHRITKSRGIRGSGKQKGTVRSTKKSSSSRKKLKRFKSPRHGRHSINMPLRPTKKFY